MPTIRIYKPSEGAPLSEVVWQRSNIGRITSFGMIAESLTKGSIDVTYKEGEEKLVLTEVLRYAGLLRDE